MPDTDELVDAQDTVDAHTEDTDDEAQVIEAEFVNGAEVAIPERNRGLAIRHVIERQLVASQDLSNELFGAATGAGSALVEAPAKVLEAIGGGATLPAAFAQTGDDLQEALNSAGTRVRSAVGDYVTGRAVLPSAVITGAADIAGTTIREQGAVAATAVNAAFNLATAAAQRGDVRDVFVDEAREVSAAARSAREQVLESVSAARRGIREAVTIDESE